MSQELSQIYILCHKRDWNLRKKRRYTVAHSNAYEVAHMMIEWPPTYKQLLFFCHLSYPLCLGSSCCFFLHLFLSMFVKQLLLFCQISPLLSSPLFCWWWNCPSPYIIWNMSWWSRTCEQLGIISSRPYITFFSLLCYDAMMLQVHDQMMIDLFLRPLLLLLLVFWYIVVL